MNKTPAILCLAALALAACLPQKAARAEQAKTEQAQPEPEKKQERSFKADEAKIARNMAAWDKLMTTPEQQYPSFKELEEQKRKNPRDNIESFIRHKRNNEEFAKHTVPIKQILPLSDKGITLIEVFYGGMASPLPMWTANAFLM